MSGLVDRFAWVLVIVAGLAGLAGGLGVNWLRTQPATAPAGPVPMHREAETGSTEVIGTRRPDFTLADATGDERSIAAFDDQVVLLNFWATWCPPCREEIPALIELQERLGGRGLQVVGVALDTPAAVRRFAEEYDIDYPLLIGSRAAFEIARAYGNAQGALPYTVVIDRDGIIREAHLGALTRAEAAALVKPLL